MANILDEIIQEVNYGISGPPQAGDVVITTEPAGHAGLEAHEAVLEEPELEAG